MLEDGSGGWVFWYHGWLLGAQGRGERLGETFGESLYGNRWRPSIHMPRWASRLTLELTEVRVERLQAISEVNARAEGCHHNGPCDHARRSCEEIGCFGPNSYRGVYADLWNSIDGPGSWEANPWVWVLSFRVHQQNVDAFLKARGA